MRIHFPETWLELILTASDFTPLLTFLQTCDYVTTRCVFQQREPNERNNMRVALFRNIVAA